MATKGASYRYGTSRGVYSNNNPRGVNYQWAKDFNKKTLERHFIEHGSEFGFTSKESYKQHAIKFANTVDRKNTTAFVDKYGTTYKINKSTKELVIVNKQGIIISYYKIKNGFYYINKKGERKWIVIKQK